MSERPGPEDTGKKAKESYSMHKALEQDRSEADAKKAETDAVIKRMSKDPGWFMRGESVRHDAKAKEANDAADAHLWRAEQDKNEHLDEYIAEAKKGAEKAGHSINLSGSGVVEHEMGGERPFKSRGAGIIFHIRSTGELMFFLRDDKPGIPFPNMPDIIGGHLEGNETPEQTARREISEELSNKDTGEPFVAGQVNHFKTFVDDRPGEHNIFVAELDEKPNIATNEGQGLIFLTPEDARSTEFAFGYGQVVNEYLDSVEQKPNPS